MRAFFAFLMLVLLSLCLAIILTVPRQPLPTGKIGSLVEQIMKQLNKLVDVIRVEDLTAEDMIARELVLIKVGANASNRNDIMHVVNTFRAKIVDVSPESLTIEVTGSEGKIDAMLELLRPFNLREVVRTGQIAMARRGELKAPSKCGTKTGVCKLKKKSKKK